MKTIGIAILLCVAPLLSGRSMQVAEQGSISGRIVPEYTGLSIGLARSTYAANGDIKLLNVATTQTSRGIGKFGEFRFEGLPPGEYYVYMSAKPAFSPAASKGEAFPTSYYPGTVNIGTASRIVVDAGADVQLGEYSLFPLPAPTVRARLIDATGDPRTSKRCATITWKERDPPDSGLNSPRQSVCSMGGIFIATVGAMPPGFYDLYAGWSESSDSPSDGGVASFEVRNADIEIDVVISLARLTGKILIENPDGTLRTQPGLQFNMTPRRLGPTLWTETTVDGSFTHDRVGQNEYMIEFTNLPPDAYVARLTEGDRDVLKDGLEVRSTDLRVDGVISLAGARLEGITAPHSLVTLIPDPPLRTHDHLYRSSTADENGTFVISGIAPGSYQVFAWSKLEGGAYKNPDFMRLYESRGTPVVLTRNERSRLSLTVVD